MYREIPLPSHVGPRVAWVVRETIDLRLSDLHALFRLPLPSLGIDAGGNFAIVDVLFAVIEGVSAVLYPRHMAEGAGFERCMLDHYKAECEPGGGLGTQAVTRALWEHFRNPIQHCLGLAISRANKQGIRESRPRNQRLLVFRDTNSLTEQEVEAIELAELWPNRLSRPTLALAGDLMILSVEAFYVGTRRLIKSVLADSDAMHLAEEALMRYFPTSHTQPESEPTVSEGIPQDSSILSDTTAGSTSESPTDWHD